VPVEDPLPARGLQPEYRYPEYDDLFARAPLHATEVIEALIELAANGLLDAVRKRIADVVAEPQTPQMLCPSRRVHEVVPGLGNRGGKP
jgi:hypothetical protein